jgi:tetratricopeptide (TPR) repeat protein
MQDDLARALAERLRPDLPTDQRRPARRPTAIPEAYRLYLRGRQEWEKRTDEAIRRAIAFYEAAIAADPSYALPHAGLADAYLAFRQQPPLETRPRAKAEAEKALALDPTLAEAHTSLAMLRFVFDWDWPEAEAGFRRSLALDPQHPTTHHWLGLYLMAMGRFDEAQAELERARTLDPFSLVVQANLARNDFFAGRDETAAARLEAALRSDHQFFLALGLLSHVRARQGRFADALAAAEQATASDDAPDSLAWLGYAAARSGRRAEARRLAAELADRSRRAPVDPYRVALVHVALGENDAAFEWLDRAYARRSPWLAYVLPDPAVDPLRRDPRFRELLGHLRLPM